VLTAFVHEYHGTLPLTVAPLHPSRAAVGLEVRHAAWPEHERRLGGFDNYWIDVEGGRFGCFNDAWNAGWYEGPQALAWAWDESGQRESVDVNVPRAAVVVRGVMLPDSHARELGLI
jgi:hypothetical protein